MILVYVGMLIIGFAALTKGADWFVDGSSSLARFFQVPGVIIGLTIVALGTSAPELAVSTAAAMAGSNEIALSNVVGSNLFNLLVVLGVCAVIKPLPVDPGISRRDFPISILATVFVLVATCFRTLTGGGLQTVAMDQVAGSVSRGIGLVLLFFFVSYIIMLIKEAKQHSGEDQEGEDSSPLKILLLILVGIVLIIAGGQAVVISAKAIARALGMSETLIGLTIVAVGTSLPELVTSIVASRKGETGMAVGNVVGSNIFNMLFILGVSSSIHPISVIAASIWDMLILIGISLLTLLFGLTKKQINRVEGLTMLLVYVGIVLFAVFR